MGAGVAKDFKDKIKRKNANYKPYSTYPEAPFCDHEKCTEDEAKDTYGYSEKAINDHKAWFSTKKNTEKFKARCISLGGAPKPKPKSGGKGSGSSRSEKV